MRQIGVIPTEEGARRFGDYLMAMNIANQVEETSSGQWAIWVEHDDHLEKATHELEAFSANPSDSQYRAAGARARDVRAEKEHRERKWRKHYFDVRTEFSGARGGYAPLTLTLIVISVIVYILSQRSQTIIESINNQLFIQPILAQTPDGYVHFEAGLTAVRHGQVWRLITPIFIHFSIMHIAFNMFWLFDLGRLIEVKRSTWLLAVLVFFSAVLGNLGQYYWTKNPDFGGMSGVVYGLFGYVWLKGRIDPSAGIGVSNGIALLMFAWLVLCMTGALGPVANEAHLIGLIVGVATAYIPHVFRKVLR